MKDLDRTQVYDLIGITEEQAKELYRRICERDKGWNDEDYRWLKEDGSLEYIHPCWVLSGREPTTHILTLFEQPYEEQLQEAKKKLKHYKKEVERLENESNPKTCVYCDCEISVDEQELECKYGEYDFLCFNCYEGLV